MEYSSDKVKSLATLLGIISTLTEAETQITASSETRAEAYTFQQGQAKQKLASAANFQTPWMAVWYTQNESQHPKVYRTENMIELS